MKRLLFLLILSSSVFADYKIEIIGNSKRWTGFPDPNYVWEGDRLVWEWTVKDEDGKDVLVKTYKKPIEIIANFKPESKVYGIEGKIEEIAVRKFGGALKGFIWLDNVSGGGEVTLPFTAEHFFIARGDRLNPVLTEISTDTSADNYYEIIEGRTHVYVRAFSGIGGAAGVPPTLIAHYKFNEDTASDNAELVTNGTFAAWTGDNPNSWTVTGETTPPTDDIDAVDITLDTFTISDEGDLSTWFKDGNIFEVAGSAGNNGLWTVASTSWSSPNFVITVVEDVTNATANGTITPHPDPDISQVGTGEGHGGTGTGFCNIYSSAADVHIRQGIPLVVGRKYRFSVNINRVADGAIAIRDYSHAMWDAVAYDTTGIKTFTFLATYTDISLGIKRTSGSGDDVTFDDVSVKLCAIEDSSSNHHDGLAQQQTSDLSVTGKIITAFDFTPNDYIIIPDHDDFTPALTPFTISSWVNADDFTNFTIASKGVEGTDGEWRLYTDGSDKLLIHCYDESINKYIGRKFNTALAQNVWIHLVATYDGGTSSTGLKLYRNSVRIDDTDDNSATFIAIENLDHDVWIGRYDTAYANGVIDNVAFYSVELSQDDINILYNNGSGTEIPAELDSKISPRRGNLSPLPLRRRWEF